MTGRTGQIMMLFAAAIGAQAVTQHMVITDSANHRVQRCLAASPGSACTTVAGTGGLGSGATQLIHPSGIAIDSSRSHDYVIVDKGNHRVQRCPAASPGSACTTVAGTGGRGSGATQFSYPYGIAIDSSHDYVIVDTYNHRVQRCPAASPGSACTTVAGTGGKGSGATQFHWPYGIAIDCYNDYVIADTYNDRIQRCPAASPGSACTTVAGTGGSTIFNSPSGIAIDSSRSHDYVIVDRAPSWDFRVQRCPAASPGSACTTVARRSYGSRPSYHAIGVAIDSSHDYVIVDFGNHRVQRCLAASPVSACTTVAGNGGQGQNATQLYYPVGVAVEALSNATGYICTLSNATGYDTSSCDAASSAKTVAQCTLTCASGYTASGATTVGCIENNGQFCIINPCQATCAMYSCPAGYTSQNQGSANVNQGHCCRATASSDTTTSGVYSSINMLSSFAVAFVAASLLQ